TEKRRSLNGKLRNKPGHPTARADARPNGKSPGAPPASAKTRSHSMFGPGESPSFGDGTCTAFREKPQSHSMFEPDEGHRLARRLAQVSAKISISLNVWARRGLSVGDGACTGFCEKLNLNQCLVPARTLGWRWRLHGVLRKTQSHSMFGP